LKEIRALLKKEHNNRGYRKPFAPSLDNYCWTHGYKIAKSHTSEIGMYPDTGHKSEATKKITWEYLKLTKMIGTARL
jgi:hypothetical protein